MSHFTLTVRLSENRLARHAGNVEEALGEMMAPYNEDAEERFLTFVDAEDELRKKYSEEGTERVRMPDGCFLLPWDKSFQLTEPPNHLERVEVPFKDTYPTFEAFVRDWSGHAAPDAKTGRYGSWDNPQGKWDWYLIGGRWSGHFPLLPGKARVLGTPGAFDNVPNASRGDVVSVGDIDFSVAASKQVERMKTFWSQWQEFLDGKRFGAFEGPRDQALTMGLVRVEKGPVMPTGSERVVSWETQLSASDERRHWSDVMTLVPEDAFFRDYVDHFDPLTTYAGLDDAGWLEPGRMLMFGMSEETPDSKLAFVRSFRERFITACGPNDRLVLVDCHA